MRKQQNHSKLVTIIAALLILLFAYTGISKLLDQDRFLNTLEHSHLLQPYAKILPYLIPIAELIIVGGLLSPTYQRIALLASFALMALFTNYIGIMLLAEEELPCSCGGVISSLSWKNHLVFNILFLILAGIGYYLSRPRQEGEGAEHP
ncbi:hypothetical protein KJS94_12405 [Flavihumibacter rivuli]|uniref:MauE/DoxX family redox-associated membrane protein n=1 Tax=Flavihumibacter rivuli TaxID=2838156 RepID=UPI001BDE7696|nr:MauE/DoxX family redox-associated membrane protein [Flavihumibacter rivuli]ULQ55444.1 hypothetical protein KJS94_12405 [Flavihumibacter rivuli]